jgi:hypothetical protein
MADLPTRLDLFALGAQYLLSKATTIEPTKVLVDGSNANCFVGSTSVMVDAVTKQLGYSVARTYLDGAVDEDLDRWAWDRYTETRKGASAAVGPIRMYRATTSAGAGTVPVGTALVTGAGIQYVTTTTVSFSATQYAAYGSVRASQAGKAAEVGPNMIQKFSQPGLLFDPTLQCNNDGTTAGGEDAEDDDTFKLRLRNFWLTARRGVLSAIVQGATSVPGVVSAEAVEALTTFPGTNVSIPAGLVNLYIADSSGVASAELAAAVVSQLNDYRAAGISVVVSTSIPLIVGVAVQVAFQAGVATAALTEQIKAALFSFVNSLGVNQTLSNADLKTVLTRFKSVGVIVSNDSIQNPTGDYVPAVGQTLRTLLQDVTVNGQ